MKRIIKLFLLFGFLSSVGCASTVLFSCSNADETKSEIEKCDYTVKALQIDDRSNASKFYIGPGIHG
jgi:major membrane immunogen (membrane-anchored lipoprotein)